MNIYNKPPEPEKYVVLECINPDIKGIGTAKFTRENGYEYPVAMFPEKDAVKIIACERMKANPSFRYGVLMAGHAPARMEVIPNVPDTKPANNTVKSIRGRRAKGR